jgi:hypothetical protein
VENCTAHRPILQCLGLYGCLQVAVQGCADGITSSYVYIRLILLTLLVGKIQHGIFSVAVFPMVTFIFPRFILAISLLGTIGFLLPDYYPLFCVIEMYRIVL